MNFPLVLTVENATPRSLQIFFRVSNFSFIDFRSGDANSNNPSFTVVPNLRYVEEFCYLIKISEYPQIRLKVSTMFLTFIFITRAYEQLV